MCAVLLGRPRAEGINLGRGTHPESQRAVGVIGVSVEGLSAARGERERQVQGSVAGSLPAPAGSVPIARPGRARDWGTRRFHPTDCDGCLHSPLHLCRPLR